MAHLEHKVKLDELVVRQVPWQWLCDNIGTRGHDWAAIIEQTDFGPSLFVSFKNKEDAVKFTLTWC